MEFLAQTDLLSTQFLVLYLLLLLRTPSGRWAFAPAVGLCLAIVAYDSLTLLSFALLMTGPLALLAGARREGLVGVALGLGIGCFIAAPMLWNTLVGRETWMPVDAALIDAGGLDPRLLFAPHHLPSRLEVVPAWLFGDAWPALRRPHATT